MGFKTERNKIYPALYVDVVCSHYIVRHPDPEDRWDIGDDGFNFEDVRVIRYECESKDRYNFNTNVGETVYVVIENYSTGCTFGYTESEYSSAGIFGTLKEAEEYIKTANKIDGYFDRHICWMIEEATIELPRY